MRREEGFTLLETLVASAILVSALTVIAGVVWAAQNSTRYVDAEGNQNEQLRLALAQMAEDVVYGHWHPDHTGTAAALQELKIRAFQPVVITTGTHASWLSNSDWQGWLGQVRRLRVQYTLEQGQLIREIHDDQPGITRVYSRQVLVDGLTVPIDTHPSLFGTVVQSGKRSIQVTLAMRRPGAPNGGEVIEARALWHLR